MTTTMNVKERFSRQEDLIPRDVLLEYSATVIGVGAIGRQVALQLTSIGVEKLILIDPDVVEESNLTTQGYREEHIGEPKIVCTGWDCKGINGQIDVTLYRERFKTHLPISPIVFCCVDTISAREFIWNNVKDQVLFFCDGRMTGQTLRIITAVHRHPESMVNYSSTLFPQEEAHVGRCTTKSTIYCANMIAGGMIAQYSLWLRKQPSYMDVTLNLPTWEVDAENYILTDSQ